MGGGWWGRGFVRPPSCFSPSNPKPQPMRSREHRIPSSAENSPSPGSTRIKLVPGISERTNTPRQQLHYLSPPGDGLPLLMVSLFRNPIGRKCSRLLDRGLTIFCMNSKSRQPKSQDMAWPGGNREKKCIIITLSTALLYVIRL